MSRPPRCAALSALAFSLSGPVLPAPAEPAATPLALSVGAAAVADMPFDFRPSARAGTALTLWVDGFEADIVKLDGDRSRISAATDAAGKDLLAVPGGDDGFPNSALGSFPRVRDDGRAMLADVNLPGLATGGGPLSIKGELVVVVATGTATAVSDPVPAGPGKVTVGDHVLEIKSIGPNSWNPEQSELTLTASAAFTSTVKAWTIRGDDGAMLSEGGPQSTMTMDDFAQLTFPLDAKPAQLTFELEVYEGLADVAVPLDLSVGIGLQ